MAVWKLFRIFAPDKNYFHYRNLMAYKVPAIVWLRMAEYTHGWLRNELGGAVRVDGKNVICVQHMRGARDILRMETVEDTLERRPVTCTMSATLYNMIDAGLTLNEEVTKRAYGIDRQGMAQFVPIECPKMRLTQDGVLRPWTNDTCFTTKQATLMNRFLRERFWQAVEEYDREYRRQRNGDFYPAVEMVEDFCDTTGTSDIHIDAIRREWQRRQKRTAHGSK